jgi:hypothetical protein
MPGGVDSIGNGFVSDYNWRAAYEPISHLELLRNTCPHLSMAAPHEYPTPKPASKTFSSGFMAAPDSHRTIGIVLQTALPTSERTTGYLLRGILILACVRQANSDPPRPCSTLLGHPKTFFEPVAVA